MKLSYKLLLGLFVFLSFNIADAQISSAIAEFESDSKGILIPRMTTNQWISIIDPVDGLMVYDSTLHAFYYHNGTSWQTINTGPKGDGISSITSTDNRDGTFDLTFTLTDMTTKRIKTPNLKGDKGEKGNPGVGIAQTISKADRTVTLSDNGGTFLDSVLTEAQVDAFVNNNGFLTAEVDGDVTNEIQTISKSGSTVTLSDNGGTFLDSVLTESQVDAFVNNNGFLTAEVDGDVTNEIQTISKSGSTVSLSNSGGSFQDSVLTEAQVDAFANNNGYLSAEVDGSTTNEIQTISKSGSTVTLSNSGGSFQDSVLTEAQVDAFTNNNGYLSTEVDGSNTNEIQTISKSGSTVTLSNSGGSFQDSVLTEAQVDAFANNNGYLSAEVDGSNNNEIQTLSFIGDTLSLSRNGGNVKIAIDSILSVHDPLVIDNDTLMIDTAGVTTGQVLGFNGNNWTPMTPNSSVAQELSFDGDTLSLSGNGGKVKIAIDSILSAKGPLIINNDTLMIDTTGVVAGQLLSFDGNNWVNMNPIAGPHTHTAASGFTGGNVSHDNMQPYLAVNYIIALQGVFPSRSSIHDPTIGEITLFAGDFPPVNWAYCDGQLIDIASNVSLFSLVYTTYGGDGRTTFALPDLRGRVAIHPGNGLGLSQRNLGQKGGTESTFLNTDQMPSHNHNIQINQN